MLAYLSRRCPELIPAVDVICEGFVGHEAQFGEMVEFARVGGTQNLPPDFPFLWVAVCNKVGKAEYFHNALCGLSQTSEPRHRDKICYTVRERTFSVSYPTDASDVSLYLRRGPHAHSSRPPQDVPKNAPEKTPPQNGPPGKENGEAPLEAVPPPAAGATANPDDKSRDSKKAASEKAGAKAPPSPPTRDAAAVPSSPRARKVRGPQLPNVQNYQPNPSVSDDATSFDRFYTTMVAAHFLKFHLDRVDTVNPMLHKYRGREGELLAFLQRQEREGGTDAERRAGSVA